MQQVEHHAAQQVTLERLWRGVPRSDRKWDALSGVATRAIRPIRVIALTNVPREPNSILAAMRTAARRISHSARWNTRIARIARIMRMHAEAILNLFLRTPSA